MWRPWNDEVENNVEVDEDVEIVEPEEFPDASLNDFFPQKPQAKRIHLQPQAKQILFNVYEYVKTEEGESEAIAKTSRMTKIPQSTIRKIILNGIQERKPRKDIGSSRVFKTHHADLIRRMIYEAYETNIVLTIEELHNKIKNQLKIKCCMDSLRIYLKKINFHYMTINKRQVLMESPRISEWRMNYLNQIAQFRNEDRPIIYLDETWYDSHDTVKKGWCDDSNKCVLDVPTSRGKRIIILHAGSKDGWVENSLFLSAKNMKDSCVDYHENMTSELFENWFGNTLLPQLATNTVIVLDNAPYHSAQTQKIPNKSSNKEQIKEFLLKNDLYFEEHYTKNQLLEVLKTKNIEKTFKIDLIAKERGHTVLRLPPYHCIFNPIEMIWHELKSHVRKRNTTSKFSNDTIDIIKEEISKISADSWFNCVRHVIKEENSYRARLVPKLIIEVGNECDDHETGDDSDFLLSD